MAFSSSAVFSVDVPPLVDLLVIGMAVASGTNPDLNRNAINYRDNRNHRDAMEIIPHFINVKY